MPNGYRFLYKADGNNIKWALVFVLFEKSVYNSVRNIYCIQSHLRVRGNDDSQYYYGVEQKGGDRPNMYIQTPPDQVKTGSGSLFGNDLIQSMAGSNNASGMCQITCCGEIPYSEVVSSKQIYIEYKRASCGMIHASYLPSGATITCSTWYKKDYGNGLVYNASSLAQLYTSNSDSIFYSGTLPLMSEAPQIPTTVSYLEENVEAKVTDGSYVSWDGTTWGKNSKIYSWVGTPQSIQAKSCLWGGGTSDVYITTSQSTTVQYAPNNVPISQEFADDTLTVKITKYPNKGSNGYFDKLVLTDGTNNYEITNLNFRTEDNTITITRDASGHLVVNNVTTTIGGNTEFTLTAKCYCSVGNHLGREVVLYTYGSSLYISNVNLIYPNDNTGRFCAVAQTVDMCFSIQLSDDLPANHSIKVGGTNFGTHTDIKLKGVNPKNAITFEIVNNGATVNSYQFTPNFDSYELPSTDDISKDEILSMTDFLSLCNASSGTVTNCNKLIQGNSTSSIDNLKNEYESNSELAISSLNGVVSILRNCYLAMKEDDTDYYINANDKEKALKDSSVIDFVIPEVSVGGSTLSYLENVIDNNTIENQVVTSISGNEYAIELEGLEQLDDILIVATDVSITDNKLVVANSYQRAILYIIENLF